MDHSSKTAEVIMAHYIVMFGCIPADQIEVDADTDKEAREKGRVVWRRRYGRLPKIEGLLKSNR
jgi:hypothetical protein